MLNLAELKHQQVRDLAVSCFSEPLLSAFDSIAGEQAPTHCSLRLTENRIAWLQQLDRNPGLLLNHLDRLKPRRLGLYHEALWHFFLQQDQEVELVTTNCQVIQGARTIGEFDVIYRDLQRQHYVHLELAFKIYLQSPPQERAGLDQWLGPNVNDRLDRKLEHMLNHQCRLSMHAAGRQLLQSIGIDHVETEISLRGYLLHDERSNQDPRLPDLLNPGLQTGQWSPVSKVIPLLERAERWYPLPRLGWISQLGPLVGDSYKPLEFAAFLRQHFAQSDASIMICAVGDNLTKRPIEQFRMMVTADSWPDCQAA